MQFRGLFIGIDRYKFNYIPWLRCARRDAVAMHALFSDTLAGKATLLVDEQATRVEIEKEIKGLYLCDEDDVVVLFFSGHGTDTHELVTFDTDRNDLDNTAIPLDSALTDWLSHIPSKRLLCILDCCFSGEMGAKVFQTGIKSKDLKSVDELLKQLSGNNRLVFTACLGTERAWENQKLGHGFLTYYLIKALLGAEEVADAGKIDIYKLFSFVTKWVKDAVASIGKSQTPTLTGRIEGELAWPVFQPGTLYKAAFPDRLIQDVSKEVSSLSVYGFSPDVLDAWAGSVKELNQLQLDAINDFGVLKGEHLVVSAPTSSGKTMIGELAALQGIRTGERALFLLPLKALVNDKYNAFNDTYGRFGLKTIRATGDYSDDIPALMRGQYDICLMTYEKFAALALASPHILEQVGVVIIDEVQMIADATRGVNLEFILTLLRMRRAQGIEPQLIALSAAIGDTNGLERWLGARLLRRSERPVPLDEGVITGSGTFRYLDASGVEQQIPSFIQPAYRKGSSQDIIIPLVQKLIWENKQVIVFRETKGEARGCALYLSRNLGLPPAQEAIDPLPKADVSRSSTDLRTALAGGVAFHIADLNPEERKLIEETFRMKDTKVRVIAATTTLAMGVNTPADAVIIAGLDHPGNQAYSVAEYKNMVGRAGRLGFTPKGFSFLVVMTPNEEYNYWTKYVSGQPEDLVSRLFERNTDPRSLILRILAASQRYAKQGMSAEDISLFLEESFGSFQQKQKVQQWQWDRVHTASLLSQLEQYGLVQKDTNSVYSLTELGWVAGKSGLEVESVLRIVRVLKDLAPTEMTDPVLITISQLTVELDNVLFPINRRSTQAEPQTWQGELQNQQIPAQVLSALYQNVSDRTEATLRAKKAVACLLWITDKPLADIEAVMTRFGGGTDSAAGPVRAVASRTCDILPVVADIAQVLHHDLDLAERIRKLLIRLEIGIPAKIVGLAGYVGAILSRGDYQRLLSVGLSTLEETEKASDQQLLEHLDGSVGKLEAVRKATQKAKEDLTVTSNQIGSPVLPPYEG